MLIAADIKNHGFGIAEVHLRVNASQIHNAMSFELNWDIFNKNNLIKLGGAKIKSKVKVISHSDGDVILHAITDSILGALSQRDIGTYFPNNKENLNRNSVEFLNYALNKMNLKKKMINNIDLMIVSEEPKINPHFKKILESISKNLNINKNSISIKATTNEKSGLIGSGNFIACWSNVSLREN